VTERCKLKVEKKAKKASSSLFCDSDMSQERSSWVVAQRKVN
jgi:hypothetical protein